MSNSYFCESAICKHFKKSLNNVDAKCSEYLNKKDK